MPDDTELEQELAEAAVYDDVAALPAPVLEGVDANHVFRFEVGTAILAQLRVQLRNRVAPEPITGLIRAPYAGFYQILHRGQEKYIGKTTRPIETRLGEHYQKLFGRQGMDLQQVEYKYVMVADPSLVDMAEKALILYFRNHTEASWNRSGFGSKVTGYGRRNQRPSQWSQEYPADLTARLTAGSETPIQLSQLIEQLANPCPLTLSIPAQMRDQFIAAHSEAVTVAREEREFREWGHVLETHLSPDWRIERYADAWYVVPR
jgi:hypothetical protein